MVYITKKCRIKLRRAANRGHDESTDSKVGLSEAGRCANDASKMTLIDARFAYVHALFKQIFKSIIFCACYIHSFNL